MVLCEWQIHELADYVRQGCDENGPVYGDLLDHLCCMVEGHMDGGMSFDEALRKSSQELPNNEIQKTEILTLNFLTMEKLSTPRMALLAMLPWSLICLIMYLGNPQLGFLQQMMRALSTIVMILSTLLLIVYGIIGWKHNFPRWTFPILGITLWSIYNVMISIFVRHNMHTGNWYVLAFVMAFVLLAVILNPSLKPFREIAQQVKDDPWSILFAFYPLLGCFAFRFLDNVTENGWRIAFAFGIMAILSWGFYTFLTIENKTKRGLVLLSSLIVIYLASWLFSM